MELRPRRPKQYTIARDAGKVAVWDIRATEVRKDGKAVTLQSFKGSEAGANGQEPRHQKNGIDLRVCPDLASASKLGTQVVELVNTMPAPLTEQEWVSGMRDYNEIKSFVEAASLVLYNPNLDWTQFESGWNEHSKGGRFIGPYAAGGTMGLGGWYNTLRSMKWPMFLGQTVSGGYTLKMECQQRMSTAEKSAVAKLPPIPPAYQIYSRAQDAAAKNHKNKQQREYSQRERRPPPEERHRSARMPGPRQCQNAGCASCGAREQDASTTV